LLKIRFLSYALLSTDYKSIEKELLMLKIDSIWSKNFIT